MSGGNFAGFKECDAEFLTGPDSRKYMWYHGSASIYALKANHGGKAEHRPEEGERRKVYLKEQSLSEAMEQWLGAVASLVSFQADSIQHIDPKTGEPYWTIDYMAANKPRLVYGHNTLG